MQTTIQTPPETPEAHIDRLAEAVLVAQLQLLGAQARYEETLVEFNGALQQYQQRN